MRGRLRLLFKWRLDHVVLPCNRVSWPEGLGRKSEFQRRGPRPSNNLNTRFSKRLLSFQALLPAQGAEGLTGLQSRLTPCHLARLCFSIWRSPGPELGAKKPGD